ncbi:hypothetical protein HPB48_026268 [Haemaphysalis longicornis]|uniref:GIY-YIG domain-containing protein n=1 Tax=Haemaphysalis longicornis TaxID=44386 RepID=A0A9J6H981_HAELO|nr:hypothetical protein HPB48_026268 [Haemaphysalis longicornis]
MVKQDNKTLQDNLCAAVQSYLKDFDNPENTLDDFILRMTSFQSTSSTGRQGYGDERNQITVTLYPEIIHEILKNKGIRRDTDQALSHGIELTVQRKTGKSLSESKPEERRKTHANVRGESTVGVVYRILMKCGKVYVGQTGRQLNTRITEHERMLRRTDKSSTLRDHCETCEICRSGCGPLFGRTAVSFKHADKFTREVIEALEMAIFGKQRCFSCPSVALSIASFEPTEKKTGTTNNYSNSETVIDAQEDATEEVHEENVPLVEDGAIKGGGYDGEGDEEQGNDNEENEEEEDYEPLLEYGEILRYYKEQRRTQPPPHPGLNRHEQVLLLQLQTRTVITPALARYVCPGRFKDYMCSECASEPATLSHILQAHHHHRDEQGGGRVNTGAVRDPQCCDTPNADTADACANAECASDTCENTTSANTTPTDIPPDVVKMITSPNCAQQRQAIQRLEEALARQERTEHSDAGATHYRAHPRLQSLDCEIPLFSNLQSFRARLLLPAKSVSLDPSLPPSGSLGHLTTSVNYLRYANGCSKTMVFLKFLKLFMDFGFAEVGMKMLEVAQHASHKIPGKFVMPKDGKHELVTSDMPRNHFFTIRLSGHNFSDHLPHAAKNHIRLQMCQFAVEFLEVIEVHEGD